MAEKKVGPRGKQLLWLVGMVLAFFAVQFVASYLARMWRLSPLAAASVTQIGILLIAGGFALLDGGGFDALGIFTRWKGFDVAAIPLVMVIHIVGSIAMAGLMMLAGLYSPESSQPAMGTFSLFGKMSVGSLTATALGLALQAGVGEEMLFRGYLITRLERLGLKAWACVLLSALIFGLVHVPGYGWAASLPKAIWLGIPTAVYFWFRRNLGPLIVAHAAIDFSLFMLLGLVLKLTGGHLPTMP